MEISSFNNEFAFLSNFFPVVIFYEDIEYPSVEHAYQASKSMFESVRHSIAKASTPGQAKRIGSLIRLGSEWEQRKLFVMENLLFLKFQKPVFRDNLLMTGSAILVEGNNWGDRYWGAELINGKWVGENNLGKLLMNIRSRMSEVENSISIGGLYDKAQMEANCRT